MKEAVFAGGCFWCVEAAFEAIEGVVSVISGYSGGNLQNPLYKQVCTGTTGHVEAVKVTYDENKISYKDLLGVFWHNIDPTDKEGQFADRGNQYKTMIFYLDEEQRREAQESKQEISKILNSEVCTEIVPLNKFYPAEEYHQDYYKKNNIHYELYKTGSGRPGRLAILWGK